MLFKLRSIAWLIAAMWFLPGALLGPRKLWRPSDRTIMLQLLIVLMTATGGGAEAHRTRVRADDKVDADAGSARASDLSGSPRAHTVAACLVGELRSIDLTGPSIRRFLLDEYEADAFVVALRHKDQGAEESMRRLVLALGNLVAVKVGTAEELLDPDLRRASIASPGQRNGYVGQGEVGHGDWPRKHTDQWLNRRLCRDLVLSHESRRGKPYNAYVRMRLDTQLFAPLPMGSFEFAAAASQHAVIPEGNDFGACEECSITDKMLLGGAAAFTADAQVHETMIANTLAELRNT